LAFVEWRLDDSETTEHAGVASLGAAANRRAPCAPSAAYTREQRYVDALDGASRRMAIIEPRQSQQ